MGNHKKFKTTKTLGKVLSFLGWIVVLLSAGIAVIMAAVNENLFTIAGGVFIVGLALGVLIVAIGQMLQIMVSIERNTSWLVCSKKEIEDQETDDIVTTCPSCGKIYQGDLSGQFCESCGAKL